MDPIGEVLNREFGSNTMMLHRTKCIALVRHVLGPWMRNELLKDLRSAPHSIYLDDATMCNVYKMSGYSVRYYSDRFKTIKDTFLKLEDVLYTTADALTKHLVDVHKKLDLDDDEFVGLSTDTTNSMVGKDHSLKTEAKKIWRNLIHIHCTPHICDLSAEDAMNELPSDLEWIITTVYNWFAKSRKIST